MRRPTIWNGRAALADVSWPGVSARRPAPARSRDHPVGAQRGDFGLAIAGLTQHLLAVLADHGRGARRHLLLPPDLDRAVDRHQLAVGESHEMPGGQHLLVLRDVVGFGDDAEDQPGLVQDAPPFGEVARREDAMMDECVFSDYQKAFDDGIVVGMPLRLMLAIAPAARSAPDRA